MMNCKEATQVAIEKEYRTLGWKEKINFHIHIWMCAPCRIFNRQMPFIIALFKKSPKHLEDLSEESMEKIKDIIQKELNK